MHTMRTGLVACLLAAAMTVVGLAPASFAAQTPAPTPTPSPSASSTPAPSSGTPTLAQMNAAHNHTMGSTIPQSQASGGKTLKASLAVSGVQGMDVSGWQTGIDWNQQYANGARFAYIKSSEGTYYTSSQFASQYNGSYAAGLIRGAYHFATPNTTDGATQARFFVQNGGGWSPDGRTLPPLLDIEYATDGSGTCWGLSPAQMSTWISDFVSTMKSLTGVPPAIYSTTNWWNTCTGSDNTFGAYPLFVARYGTSTPGALPASWLNWTMWQYADSGTFPGDQDIFNGSGTQLQQFAYGAQNHPPIGSYDTASVTNGQPFSVTGWGFDQTNLGATTQIQILWSTPSGETTTTVSANGSRPDVGNAFPGVGNNHGFSATAPWAGYGQYGACVTVKALPGDTAGDASLGCKTAFISAATATTPAAQRFAGGDRFATAVAVSQATYANPGVPVVYIASGFDFPDALAAAPAAAVQKGPVLLTTPGSIPDATMAEINRLQPHRIVVVGGTDAVSDAAFAQLSATNIAITRIGGADRFETSRQIAAYAFPAARSAYIATGFSYSDALSAAPAAAKGGEPLILVGGGAFDAATASYLSSHSMTTATVAGGQNVVSDSWVSQAKSAGVNVLRIGGADRFATSALINAAAFPAGSASKAYIASALAWPDALVAAAAAGSTPQPLLLAQQGCVPRVIGDQLVRLGTTGTQIAGGTDVLSTDVNGLQVCF